GIEKCFVDNAGYTPEDLIRWTADRQVDELAARELPFADLWGRPLQLIDCQNLFCEVDKYARVVHPEAASKSGRTRIKQRFRPDRPPLEVGFPPKWKLNQPAPGSAEPLDASFDEIGGAGTSSRYGRVADSPGSINIQGRLAPVVSST